MNQLNSIILEGNLVRDPVLSEPAAGFKVCKFTIGVNRFYKNRNDEATQEVSFFEVEGFGKLAEYCQKKATKGRGVRIVGRLKQDLWKDSNGKQQNKVYVVAEHIEYKPVNNKNDNAYAGANENSTECDENAPAKNETALVEDTVF